MLQNRVAVVTRLLVLTLVAAASARGATAPASAPATTTATATSTAPAADGDWTILFRGDDPTLWNTDGGGGDTAAENYAIKLEKTPQAVRYLRLKRLDTGDAVIIPAPRDVVVRRGDLAGKQYFWNGASDVIMRDGTTHRLLGLAYKSWNAERAGQHHVNRWQRRGDAGWRGWGFSK